VHGVVEVLLVTLVVAHATSVRAVADLHVWNALLADFVLKPSNLHLAITKRTVYLGLQGFILL
jgi:hypothetical protein